VAKLCKLKPGPSLVAASTEELRSDMVLFGVVPYIAVERLSAAEQS
jgi:hypothetical protein